MPVRRATRNAPQRPSRPLAIAIALLLAAAAVLFAARPADAGSYVATQCSAANPTPGQARWERDSDHYRGRAACGGGDGLAAYHDAAESGLWHYGAWVWRAPEGTVFTSVQANASLTNQAGHRGQLVVTRPGGGLVEFGSEHADFRVHSIAGEFTQFHGWLRCVAPGPGRPCGRAGDESAHAYVRGVFLRVEDRSAPTAALAGGSLLADPVVRGTRSLAIAAADRGGGVRRLSILGNGAVLAEDVLNCALADRFATALTPCPTAAAVPLPVATAGPAFATGPNEVLACAEDLALDGLANRTCRRTSVWIDNACPASALAGSSLSAGFDGSARAAVRSDRSAVIRGRVGGPAGGVAGATVCALTRTLIAGEPILVAAVAVSAADGSYELELPPGPSREVFVHHAFGDRVLARHGLVVRSTARPTLSVEPARARAGDRLGFEGRLPGPACEDRVVKVQARIGRRRWQVFRTDRSDAGCRFEARYRLRATRDARRYRFRALVPGQDGYPYEPGYSARAVVAIERDHGA